MSRTKSDQPKKPRRDRERPVIKRGSPWPAILAATALPVLGGLSVFVLVATGKAKFDDSFFFGYLARFLVGGLCLGVVLSVIWARLTRGDKLNWFQKVNVPIIVVLVSLFGFYFCAPDDYTRPVTAVLKDIGAFILEVTSSPPPADNAAG